MQLIGLTRLIAALDPVAQISGQSHARVAGLMKAATTGLAAALRELNRAPLLVVTSHPHEAIEMVSDLQLWTDAPVLLFPAIESLPYERVRADRSVLGQRSAVLRALTAGEAPIIVAPVRALLQPVPAHAASTSQAARLRVGDEVQIDTLLGAWTSGGYSATDLVREPGTFARRGGVIDVYPVDLQTPVRIELFGSEIESLRSFDPASQRSVAPVQDVFVGEISLVDTSVRSRTLERLLSIDAANLNAEAGTAWLEDLGHLEAGVPADELGMFAPYFVAEPVSLIDHLPTNARVVVDGRDEITAVSTELWRQGVEVQQSLEKSGNLPAGLIPALLEPGAAFANISGVRHIEILRGSASSDELDWSGMFQPARLYAGQVRTAVRDLTTRSPARHVILTQQDERLAELLEDEGVTPRRLSALPGPPEYGISLLSGSLGEGWVLPAAGVSLLTDRELFGRTRSRPVMRRTRPAREAFFTQFSSGDYVVHLEHGIGRFEEVTRMTIDGAEREYAVVQYAGADRVYVPTDQLERLTRYIGVGDSAPKLNKLGGGEWQRTRQRAEAAAADIARELIDVYAKRMAREAHAFAPDVTWQHELESSFPYAETADQLQAVEDVKADMEAGRPMDRLVCADVGYGKTEVAVRAAFKAILDGKQVAVLVPTTILAQQHYETFTDRFSGFPIKVEALSRFRTPVQQREILRRAAAGEVDLLIGTHRLLQKDVHFKDLGLLVVDEEQRFGVRHKEHLKRWREAIDVLTLTATPIPRTLHMGLVGIREISIIETPPEGRLPIKTYLQPYEDRLVREAVLREMEREGQVYFVHNKVATIEALAERIRTLVPEARIVVAHGQMDEALLERVMIQFAKREADVLICSTIIENGLDIPNVNTIVVNHAHRLGLTQLYQLRGRVGRSENQAYAYLLYPRDVRLSHDASRRLEAVFEAQNLGAGMNIAMKDLEIRGVGNLLGAEQSGHATAIGFDLYTRMIGEAVERLRGVAVEEVASVSIDLPLTMFLPAEYVGNEAERLTLYRRLAAISGPEDLEAIAGEIADRFGPLPVPVHNLLTSIRIKLAARAAKVTLLALSAEELVMRLGPGGLYDRVSLYRSFGMDAKISTNVLRIPRRRIGNDWLEVVRNVLADMVNLRSSLSRPEPVEA